MQRFIFILGSNWQLSIAELDNYLKYSLNKGRIIDYSANVAIVEFDELHHDSHYINKLMEVQFVLGGCQKIGQIYDFIDIKTIQDAFPLQVKNFRYVEKPRKKILDIIDNLIVGKMGIFLKVYTSMFFAVSIYPNLYDDKYYSEILVKHFLPFLNKEIMSILKQKGAEKVLYYQYPEKYINSGHLNPIFPHHVIKYELLKENRAEIIFGFTEEGLYIARTFTVDDPNFKKKIDEEKPYKEFRSAISPKLTLAMLNFLNLYENRHNKKILDPFVGNGTIILFGILQDFQVYGSDKDNQKVNNTIRNIDWLLEFLEEEIPPFIHQRIIQKNARNLSDFFEQYFFDGIVSEPELGPFYTEKPYYSQVKKLIDTELTPLYDEFLREAYKILKIESRLCFISPIISTLDGNDLQVNIENIAKKNKFRLIPMIDLSRIPNKSNEKLRFRKQHVKNIIDAKKGQILKRKLYLLEKIEKT
ncbi:MAG: TRM11 family SAM-dependent methyltransferase [Candidatus Odinarchaeota archaeon]